MAKIFLVDVTNRDGVQTAKLGLSKLAKTMINIYLNDLGVFQSEFGFPTTRHEANYLKANLELQEMGVLKPIRLGGWLRATADDVNRAFEAIRYKSIARSARPLTCACRCPRGGPGARGPGGHPGGPRAARACTPA